MTGRLKNSEKKLAGKELVRAIEKAVGGLTYMSETDAAVEVFSGGKSGAVSESEFRKLAGVPPGSPVEIRAFEDFFRRPASVHEWSDERARKSAARYAGLRELLRENLSGLVCCRTGRIRISVYVLGIDAEGYVAGIRTEAVET